MRYPVNDEKYLKLLQDYYARWRSLPSYAKLSEVLGIAAPSAVMKVLNRLNNAGYLDRTPDKVWIPSERFFERSFSDFRIPAGSPVSTNEASGDGFLVDSYLVKNPSLTTFMPVTGDSMIGAGINDGDMAVVEKREDAKEGDLVVALVDDEATLKELTKENGVYILKPANPAYGIIRPKGDLKILGIVVGIIRKIR